MNRSMSLPAVALILGMAFASLAVAQQGRPAIGPVDCRSPKGADEATICRTPDLQTMDGELDRAYRAARMRWTASLSNSIRVMHEEWLKKRQACGPDGACIMTRIVEQIRELDASRPTDPQWILKIGK